MVELLGIALAAGVIAGISPCIVPVFPVLLASGATDSGRDKERRRPLAVVAGLVLSFTIITLVGSELLSLLHLPQDLLRNVGLVLLGAIGLGLIVPAIGAVLSRPFERVRMPRLSRSSPGFLIGISLGAVFAPCAGPVLTAIIVVSSSHHLGLESVLLTLCFSLGAASLLFLVALVGTEIAARTGALKRRAPLIRFVGGLVLLTMAALLATNELSGLQRTVPAFTSALQHDIEGGALASKELSALTSSASRARPAPRGSVCLPAASTLESCGAAPHFAGITTWLNSAHDRPVSIASLRHEVVLVDFWTYSCINCQRSLDHVEAWWKRYRSDGFEVVGIHTPEFAFEHVTSNVRAAAAELGVRYPIALDNHYSTWNVYVNQGWPAEYLVDGSGQIRHYQVGEGGYATTETLIRELLLADHPGTPLPPRTDVRDLTPSGTMTPETYLGYSRLSGLDASITKDAPTTYRFPPSLPVGYFGIAGVWTIHQQEMTAGPNAKLDYPVEAKEVYLVLGGNGTVEVNVAGLPPRTIEVSGVPRLYTLLEGPKSFSSTIMLNFTPGVEAYDFTFG